MLEMKYFVLKPGGRDEYAVASRLAMLKYAEFIEEVDEQLSKHLTEWVDREYCSCYSLQSAQSAIKNREDKLSYRCQR